MLSHYRRQILFILDIVINLAVCALLFLFFPSEEGISSVSMFLLLPDLIILICCIAFFQIILKSYDSLWRYAESQEYLNLFIGMFLGLCMYLAINALLLHSMLSNVFFICACSVSLVLMLLMRFLYRRFRNFTYSRNTIGKTYAAIIGAGNAGAGIIRELKTDPTARYIPYCLFDDDPGKLGTRIMGVEVRGNIESIPRVLKSSPVKELILAIPSASDERRKEILEACTQYGKKIRILPRTVEILLSSNSVELTKAVREVRIEDLLGRSQIDLDMNAVDTFLSGRTVLVTGGGGSIGSELCRQIAKASPKRLVILDIYENNAYEIQQELKREYAEKLDLDVEIASVRDRDKIDALFDCIRPDIVFHAAAHKHVPLMEHCPSEAIKNNICGTLNVVQAADRFNVQKFILISTDKAVNPTNIMGASKRFCEMIIQSMRTTSKTEFAAVRFGNVLGSNGSVVPLFRKQIDEGGPVTITDKRIIRYFMSIPEAAQLVLQAGAIAGSSDVFVLDMGDPVHIVTLAENMIRLSGHEPYKEIPIVEIGLRPGEKLYEELLMKKENLTKTNHKKIFIENLAEIGNEQILRDVQELMKAAETGDFDIIKTAMRRAVDTYHDPAEVNSHMELQKASVGTVESDY